MTFGRMRGRSPGISVAEPRTRPGVWERGVRRIWCRRAIEDGKYGIVMIQEEGPTSLVIRMTNIERLTSVFIPCSLANSIKLSSFLSRSLSRGLDLASTSGFPCQPAPTSHHFPRVSDWRRSSRDTRSGSFVNTGSSVFDFYMNHGEEWGIGDLRLRFFPRDDRKRLGSFFADFKDVKVSNMNLVRTLPPDQLHHHDRDWRGWILTSYPDFWSFR